MSEEMGHRPIVTTRYKEYSLAIGMPPKYLKPDQPPSPKPKLIPSASSQSNPSNKNQLTNTLRLAQGEPTKTIANNSSQKSIKTPLNSSNPSVSKESQAAREKQFKRKNNRRVDPKRSRSRKNSRPSTDNQNEETLIERLRVSSQFYRKAYLASKHNLLKLEHTLQQQKHRRSHQSGWFKSQIDSLNRRLSVDRVRLSHIFTFEAFENPEVSNVIVESENESSSMVHNHQKKGEYQRQLSQLSIESK